MDDDGVCSHWTSEEFYACAEDKFEEAILAENFTCSVVWLARYFPDHAAGECHYERDFGEVVRVGQWLFRHNTFPQLFSLNPGRHGCPRPCTSYKFDLACDRRHEEFSFLAMVEERNGTGVAPAGQTLRVGILKKKKNTDL